MSLLNKTGGILLMSTKQSRLTLPDCALMVILAMAMAVNYQIFILQNAFAPAGINGIATMIQYLFHFSIGYMSLIINIPLAIFAFFYVDRAFTVKTFIFTLSFSGFLLLLQNNVSDVSRFI